MAGSTKPIGRIAFVLRMLLITVLIVVVERLLQFKPLAHLNSLPPVLQELPQVTSSCLVGSFLGNTIRGRLVDAKLPHWYLWPVFLVFIFSTISLVPGTHYWPIFIAVSILILIAGGVIPSKPAPIEIAYEEGIFGGGMETTTPEKKFPARSLIGPIGFLRCLLALACIWFPLIYLDVSSTDSLQTLVAHLGYLFLGILWIFVVISRLEDTGYSSEWTLISYLLIVPTACLAPMSLWGFNSYESLGIFLLIQLPIALLPGDAARRETGRQERFEENEKRRLSRRINRKILLVGRYKFLWNILILACLWGVLMKIEDASVDGVGVFVASLGYLALASVWMMQAHCRFEDAGKANNFNTTQYLLTVSFLTFMPQAFSWINRYEAIALFVIVQVPTVLMRSAPKPKVLLPEIAGPDLNSDEGTPEEEAKEYLPVRAERQYQGEPIGPTSYLLVLLLLACIWLLPIFIEDASGQGLGVWIARLGYCVLGFLWFGVTILRFKDAGFQTGSYPTQYCVIVALASLTPLVFHWVNGYGALGIFYLIQIPTVLLHSKPLPDEPFPESNGAERNEGLRDPLGGILVRNTEAVGAAYPRKKPALYTGGAFGRAKKRSSWRRFDP